jgi:hypothetical protein
MKKFMILLLVLQPVGAKPKIGSPVPEFVLQDQYGNQMRPSDFPGRVVLLVCGDRTGSEYIGMWAGPVIDKFGSAPTAPVRVVHAANLEAVPSFLQGIVKKRFSQPNGDGTVKRPVLLDWNGHIARLLGFEEGLANVYLIDRSGMLAFTGAGRGTPAEVAALMEAIDRALGTK